MYREPFPITTRIPFLLSITILTILYSHTIAAQSSLPSLPAEDIIADICNTLAEDEPINSEELQNTLLDLANHPINLNTATQDELSQLQFLSPKQIDEILYYVYLHPMDSIVELKLIPFLSDIDRRNLLPFVCVQKSPPPIVSSFTPIKHEILSRTDARYIENPKQDDQHDPIYAQLRYKLRASDLLQAGITLRRPTGAQAADMQYGLYTQLNHIGALRTLVLGDYDAAFGYGLVSTSSFRMGKQNYIMNTATGMEGLKKRTTIDSTAMHGIGASVRIHRFTLSSWYSLNRENDSLTRHIIGFNTNYQHKQLKIGFTMTEKLYSDTLRYFHEHAKYNQNYFRGKNQWVGGLNYRYHWKRVQLHGEIAAAQNKKWGVGSLTGLSYYPMSDIGLTLLYRYYSPYFDNTLGYAFSETSRVNDENGIYFGTEIHAPRHWTLSTYADLFRFDAIKYGIPYAPSYGYDAMMQAAYSNNTPYNTSLRFRARNKAKKETYSLRWQNQWTWSQWRIRTLLDANLHRDSLHTLTYGAAISQDIQYSFLSLPLVIQGRIQGFYTPNWNNRIYIHNLDVLYAYSQSATYGIGGKVCINIRWKITNIFNLYLNLSETLYTRQWQQQRQLPTPSHTDIHLLLRVYI